MPCTCVCVWECGAHSLTEEDAGQLASPPSPPTRPADTAHLSGRGLLVVTMTHSGVRTLRSEVTLLRCRAVQGPLPCTPAPGAHTPCVSLGRPARRPRGSSQHLTKASLVPTVPRMEWQPGAPRFAPFITRETGAESQEARPGLAMAFPTRTCGEPSGIPWAASFLRTRDSSALGEAGATCRAGVGRAGLPVPEGAGRACPEEDEGNGEALC